MKLTLSKETLRKLAVHTALRAGYNVASVQQVCPGGGLRIGPNVSQTTPICDGPPDLHKAANPAKGLGDIRPELP